MPGHDVGSKPLRLELRQLRYVTMVAECGSITSARPSLSEALSRLEQDLDTALLVPGKHGVILTGAGATTLAETGRQVRDTIDTTLEQVQKPGHQSRRKIAGGLPMTLAGPMAVPLADSIANEHPDIRVQITEATTTVQLEQLASGALDLAVCYGGADFDAFAAQPIFEEKLFLVAASDNWNESPFIDGLAQKAIAFERLADLPLVLPAKQNPMRLMLDRLARRINAS
ncbi:MULTISPECIES: LysR substrate-binding domain-containing protein [Paracoccus]|uniref:LysR family transcriptional regulator n=1 Tax=Paracoccus TaxID=265 RepID=UPI001FB82CB2|nr:MULTISPECIES: LysR substrate-binding domain-containing protein [Paracoccus]MCJ1899490.1 LysR substrate-binding domain-containing protein [Paracoccus versutus]MDF3904785.1 LysR substrate-binding domain-containing protein [Paracoccus sp. AS002]